MSFGYFVLHTALIIGAPQSSTNFCDLPSVSNSNLSSSAPRVDCKPGPPLQKPFAEDSELQISSTADAVGAGPHSNQLQANQQAQDSEADNPKTGSISGTVTDENRDVISGAEVVLESVAPALRRTVTADQNGSFEFQNLESGDSYHISVSANGFVGWKSDALHLDPGQFLIVDKIGLKVDGGPMSVTVTASPVEIATEEVRIAEHQRVLGFIPNFLVVYDRNPAPLTAKLKFKLALRVAVDPVTFFGVAGFAAINQGANTPNYVQGLKGYGQRAGALYADGFTDLMLGGAILPSLLHQDPRYIYKGTGTTKSRLARALMSPFWCRGDNGKWQVNYSSLGGDLGSTAISEAYYPASNRGPGLVFGNFLIGTGERMVSGLAQEFLLRKLTPSAAKNANH